MPRAELQTALWSSVGRFHPISPRRAASSRSMPRLSGSRLRRSWRTAIRMPALSSPAGQPRSILRHRSKRHFAVKEFEALGIPHERITAEEQSRNTIENAVFSYLIAQPKPGERWLLVTSAFHMPRSIAVFRAAGFAVEAYPVDFRTRGPGDATRLFRSVADGLLQTDQAMHEWAG